MTGPTPVKEPPHPVLDAYYRDEEDRERFVRGIFDRTATDYDRVERLLALGSGSRYRRQALERAGLVPGMQVLDVATGTGLLSREAMRLAGPEGAVFGVDTSAGMLAEARAALPLPCSQGRAEALPFPEGRFDLVTMGFALRHISDLHVTFGEFRRVLRPGGRVCILEITRPRNRVSRLLLRAYLGGIVPWAAGIVTGHREMARLMRYYWDTIDSCVPAERIMDAMAGAGFVDVERHVELGLFSEYRASVSAST